MDLRVITKSRGDALVSAADEPDEGKAFQKIKQLHEYQEIPVDSQDTLRFATCLMKAAGQNYAKVRSNNTVSSCGVLCFALNVLRFAGDAQIVMYLLEERNAELCVTDNVGWTGQEFGLSQMRVTPTELSSASFLSVALFWALVGVPNKAPGDSTIVRLLWHRACKLDELRVGAPKSTGGGGGGGAAGRAEGETGCAQWCAGEEGVDDRRRWWHGRCDPDRSHSHLHCVDVDDGR